jgi:hypothetical protein
MLSVDAGATLVPLLLQLLLFGLTYQLDRRTLFAKHADDHLPVLPVSAPA